jgi:hypothetical protein
MTETTNPVQPDPATAETPAAPTAAEQQPTHRPISDPREVAKIVMARMKQVEVKKDEFTAAINGLVDLTRQLTRTYAEQQLAIEQLRRRLKTLEAAAPSESPVTLN